MISRFLVFLCYIFLTILSFGQDRLTLELKKNNKVEFKVHYYKANFIKIDSIEFVDYKVDNIGYLQNDNLVIIPIPYNSCYIIELYDGNEYRYIQIESGNSDIPILKFKYSDLSTNRNCFFFDRKNKSYKYFVVNEKVR